MYICVCLYVCIHLYIYIYIYTYLFIYTCDARARRSRDPPGWRLLEALAEKAEVARQRLVFVAGFDTLRNLQKNAHIYLYIYI